MITNWFVIASSVLGGSLQNLGDGFNLGTEWECRFPEARGYLTEITGG
jgi:hypothetical protein